MKNLKKPRTLLMGALLLGTLLSAVAGVPLLAGAAMAFGGGALTSMANVQLHAPGAFNITLASLAWGDGDDNMGGLRTKVYWCMHSEVDTHAAPMARADATNYADLSTITTDHTFNVGKAWKSFYTTEDTGMVESVMQGELDGKSWLNKIKLHFPGGQTDILGFLRWIQNAGTYWIGVDAEGRKRMVGSEHWPAKLVASTITTTETAAGRKGATIEAQCSSPWPAPIVTASIDLEDDSSDA